MNYLLQTVFEREYSFIPVADVFHAMHVIKTERKFSALLVDVDFQPQSSWELVQHIKSSRLFNIPVIILASENNEDLKNKCYQFEVDEIFFKPFNPVDLTIAIKNLLSAEPIAGVS